MEQSIVEGLNRRSRRCQKNGARYGTIACQFVLTLSWAMACQSALAQALYRIKPLGNLGGCTASVPLAYGFNWADEVTGQVCNANGDLHAFLWRNDGNPMIDLGPDGAGYAINGSGLIAGTAQDSTGKFGFVSFGDGRPVTKIPNGLGGTPTSAYAVNRSGQVTGYAVANDTTEHAFLWKDDGSSMRDLGTFADIGYPYTEGEAINASGQVAGSSFDGAGSYRAFVWKNDGTPMLDLGDLGGYRTTPCCINASGQIAGSSSVIGFANPHAFLWRNDGTPMLDLGTLARGSLSAAFALNNSGQVAGWSYTYLKTRRHAFAWMNDGTPMKNLGTFGGTSSQSNDINASGQVTGWANLAGDSTVHAFLWKNNGMKIQDLNKLIEATDPLKSYVTLISGAFINNLGDIVAEGTDSRTGSGLYLLQGIVLTLSPRSLAFGNVPIHTTSAVKSVTVTNTRAKSEAITGVTLTGGDANQFARTQNCGNSLAGHATCLIKMTFKPTAKGAESAILNVYGGGGELATVSVTGTGG